MTNKKHELEAFRTVFKNAKKAANYYNDCKYNKALQYYAIAIKDFDYYRKLVQERLEYSGSKTSVQEEIKVWRFGDIFYKYGLVCKAAKLYSNAELHFNKASEWSGGEPGIYNKKSELFLEQKKYNEALECTDEAIQNETYDELTFYIKGKALLEIDRLDEAINCFDKAIEHLPLYEYCNTAINHNGLYCDANYKKAIAFFKLNKQNEAMNSLNQATRLCYDWIIRNTEDIEAKRKVVYTQINTIQAFLLKIEILNSDNKELIKLEKELNQCVRYSKDVLDKYPLSLDTAYYDNWKYLILVDEIIK
jgi:tetratricopeptide (TPR) repeat protein